MPEIDPNLPSIHFIGSDLIRRLEQRSQQAYAIDAASIHKYADDQGTLIQNAKESPKIVDRLSLTYQADYSLSQDYFQKKWPLEPTVPPAISPTGSQNTLLDSPIILLGRGGGGTRLLSNLVQDCGLFVGNNVNQAGDCMELVHTMYRSVIAKNLNAINTSIETTASEIRAQAYDILAQANWPNHWGFKLPESLLLLPELHAAFPNARYVYFHRDPLSTILRRSHMTARLDNHIGRVAVRAAYDYFDIDRHDALSADDPTRMAVTTAHQLALVAKHKSIIPTDRWLDLSFEETIANPQSQLNLFSEFTGLPILHQNTRDTVDKNRSTKGPESFTLETRAKIETLFRNLSPNHIG